MQESSLRQVVHGVVSVFKHTLFEPSGISFSVSILVATQSLTRLKFSETVCAGIGNARDSSTSTAFIRAGVAIQGEGREWRE